MRLAFFFFLVASTILMVVSAQKPKPINCDKVCVKTCPTPTPSDPGYNFCQVLQKSCKCGAATTTTTAAPTTAKFQRRS